ncbi:hypothetical protein EJ06DRAFT_526676 [Trichodelitschia bisporula]|uniref:FAD/NAD(P)-binding domain-containing protein n=1 Tax=Trichodelitschia bisporula TaxID=703511 RepID=A0A6G1I8H3_9PEZI|nr:hypothetical protein EJ06DRAFT_526676 [Trichodelitschia bisporula]
MADSTLTSKPGPTKEILVLGGSYAGVGAAQYILNHIVPALSSKGTYHVTLVSTSSHIYHRPTAPRGAVNHSLMPAAKTAIPVIDQFKKYDADKFTFVQGTATSADPTARIATIALADGTSTTYAYHALVIATGVRTPSPILGLQTTHTALEAAQVAFQKALPNVKSIIVGGGGPAAVETAAELGEELNGAAGFLAGKHKAPKVKITVITADSKLLPILRPAIGKAAEGYLNRVGVDVVYNARVEAVTPAAAGKVDPATGNLDSLFAAATVTLSTGETHDADIYIPATGVAPNTEFLPANVLDARGYVDSNPETLRVEKAGPRVYVLGDVGNYTRGGIMEIAAALPVVMTNLKRDLLWDAAGAPEGTAMKGKDRTFSKNSSEMQIVPVGRSKGVGAIFGWRVPSIFVWLIKGRDFMVGMLAGYIDGSMVAKESKWKDEAVV